LAIVLGYHGCDIRTAQALLGGSSFVASKRAYDWLGNGSYFWEADFVRAYEWAQERRSYAPSLVGAVIELGNCLDLTTRSGTEVVKEAHVSFLELQQERGEPIPRNLAAKGSKSSDTVLRYLDRAVIDHLHSGYQRASEESGGRIREFDTVRALFPEGEPLYAGAGFREKTHVQIAVRNPKQIRGIFRVPSHELAEFGIPDIYAAA
jgi:hypothetical protein